MGLSNTNTKLLQMSSLQLLSTMKLLQKHFGLEADKIRRENYGNDVYVRGLIEFSNYCKE